MANSNKYKELEERIKLCDDPEDKMDYMATMLFMITNNDLATIEKKQKEIIKKLNKYTVFIILAILIGMIGSNQGAMSFIIGLIMKGL